MTHNLTIAEFVAEVEAAINQIDPEFVVQRSELFGFVKGCWPCSGTPAEVAEEFVEEGYACGEGAPPL